MILLTISQMTINGSTAFEYPIEVLEKSSGCAGWQVNTPSQDVEREMSLTSWVFNYIAKISTEEDPLSLKRIYCISRK